MEEDRVVSFTFILKNHLFGMVLEVQMRLNKCRKSGQAH